MVILTLEAHIPHLGTQVLLLPWLMVVLGVACGAAILFRSRASSLFLACGTLVIAVCYTPLFLPSLRPGRPASPGPAFRVMSFSAWTGGRTSAPEAITDMILLQRPDAIAIQEVDAKKLGQIRSALSKRDVATRWHTVADLSIGQAVISRFPVQRVASEAHKTRLLRVHIATEAGPVAVWNIHAFRPDFAQSGLSFLAYGSGRLPQPDSRGQIDWLAAEVVKEPLPLVLLGDFNFPYRSPDHDYLSTIMRDAHWEAGWGFGFSFPANTDHVRWLSILGQTVSVASSIRITKIDHIFINDNFDVLAAQTSGDSAGSDHAAVVADLVLRQGSGSPHALSVLSFAQAHSIERSYASPGSVGSPQFWAMTQVRAPEHVGTSTRRAADSHSKLCNAIGCGWRSH
jgi:endonuclease/exonuclease/phosphatase family metal-dependent hydrolase